MLANIWSRHGSETRTMQVMSPNGASGLAKVGKESSATVSAPLGKARSRKCTTQGILLGLLVMGLASTVHAYAWVGGASECVASNKTLATKNVPPGQFMQGSYTTAITRGTAKATVYPATSTEVNDVYTTHIDYGHPYSCTVQHVQYVSGVHEIRISWDPGIKYANWIMTHATVTPYSNPQEPPPAGPSLAGAGSTSGATVYGFPDCATQNQTSDQLLTIQHYGCLTKSTGWQEGGECFVANAPSGQVDVFYFGQYETNYQGQNCLKQPPPPAGVGVYPVIYLCPNGQLVEQSWYISAYNACG